MKGATDFDKICHYLFSAKGNGTNYRCNGVRMRCRVCGHPLLVYYCEEQLCLVECDYCRKKALVKARNYQEAVFRTFGDGEPSRFELLKERIEVIE